MGVEYRAGVFQGVSMSARSDVTLTVLTVHEERVNKIATRHGLGESWEKCIFNTDPLSQALFPDMKYATLPFLPELKENGIPYILTWASYDDVEAGQEFCRYSENGELVSKEIDDSQWDSISLSGVESCLDMPIALRQYVKEQREYLTILPWDNQEEYGLKYVALQLIRSKENQ